MYRVAQELVEDFLVDGEVLVDGHIGLLVQHVVKAGRPLAAAQAGCVGAVVHHEGHAPCVHVGVERVHSLPVQGYPSTTGYKGWLRGLG